MSFNKSFERVECSKENERVGTVLLLPKHGIEKHNKTKENEEISQNLSWQTAVDITLYK